MTIEDRVQRALQRSVADVEPRPEAWDEIRTVRAGSRRASRRRPVLLGAAAAAVLLVVAVSVGSSLRPAADRQRVDTAAAPTVPATAPATEIPALTVPTPTSEIPTPTTGAPPSSSPPAPAPSPTPTTTLPTSPPTTSDTMVASSPPSVAVTYLGFRFTAASEGVLVPADGNSEGPALQVLQGRVTTGALPHHLGQVVEQGSPGSMVWLSRPEIVGRSAPALEVVDAIVLPDLAADERLILQGRCSLTGAAADGVFAVVGGAEPAGELPARRAWRADPGTGRISEIDPAGVQCRDPDTGG